VTKKERKDKRRFHGKFTLGSQECFGELQIKGRRTRLSLSASKELPSVRAVDSIIGQTLDGTYLTCVDCVGSSQGGTFDGTYQYANVFPHYVLVGDRPLSPSKRVVRQISFTVDDLATIFYDCDAFGSMPDTTGVIDQVLAPRRAHRDIEVGPWAYVAYFTGKCEVAVVETVIGTISVSHRPSFGSGGSEGVHMDNQMYLSIDFKEPLEFEQTIDHVLSVLRFLAVTAGRVQGIHNIEIRTDEDLQDPLRKPTLVYWSLGPKSADRTNPNHKPSPGDVPFHPLKSADELGQVLANWVKQDTDRCVARERYMSCLGRANKYGADRIVAAANMFDVLPKDAAPAKAELADDLAKAQEEIIAILKKVSKNDERDVAIGAIKRLGSPTLRMKVFHRAKFVTDQIGSSFPQLEEVLKLAIKCRNHFVHGSDDGFEFDRVAPSVPFLTDALEFTFAASEFIEAGWNAEAWNKEHHGFGHGFARFRMNYREGLARLRSVGALRAPS
jgi:hypothetical protein